MKPVGETYCLALRRCVQGMDLKIVQSVLAAAILFMTKEELVKLAFVLLRPNKGRTLAA